MEIHSKEQLDSNLNQCQLRLRYFFHNVSLLRTALTHSSGADTPLMSNERMEFLGDAILGYTICEKLFEQFPDLQEGELTKIKSEVVSRATCNELGKELGLDEFLVLGRGLTPKRLPNSILANTMEAVIAAIYLDGGMTVVQKFILQVFGPVINKVSQNTDGNNFKSVLQQISQRELHASPEYVVITTSGPDHGRCFKVLVKIKQHKFAPAWGNTKKEAEQRAAENALAMLAGNTPPYGE